jgi:hypothetical protein
MSRVQTSIYAILAGLDPISDIDRLLELYGMDGVKAVLHALNNFRPNHLNFSPFARIPTNMLADQNGYSIIAGSFEVIAGTVVGTVWAPWKVPKYGVAGRFTIKRLTAKPLLDSATAAGVRRVDLFVNGVASGFSCNLSGVLVADPAVHDTTGTTTTLDPGDELTLRFTMAAGETLSPGAVSVLLFGPQKEE